VSLEQRVRLPAWRRYASCRGMATLFYSADPVSESIAVAVCAGCGVREACAAEALEVEAGGECYGVRAGMRPEERRAAVSQVNSRSTTSVPAGRSAM
jgi:hypothetical protein